MKNKENFFHTHTPTSQTKSNSKTSIHTRPIPTNTEKPYILPQFTHKKSTLYTCFLYAPMLLYA